LSQKTKLTGSFNSITWL